MISDAIRYIGVEDRAIDLFEGQYAVPNGMCYNSYLIVDEKIAVLDTADGRFGDEWLAGLRSELSGRNPDYLVVHHMEPDHSACIKRFADAYPSAVIVSSRQAFVMMKQFFGTDFSDRRLEVKEGSVLSLGKHSLTFVGAPMVHWPEVLMSYESAEGILFSADGFGKFGVMDAAEPWADEARRYYIGIVGKYGAQVQSVLKKAAGLDIRMICPLHGPILKDNLDEYLRLYDLWSSYQPEEDGTVIAYTSVYGHTREAALLLAEELKAAGARKVVLHDLARDDLAESISDAFRYSRLVLATTTYNTSIFPAMHTFLHGLAERNFQNRTLALLENGSWAPMAAKGMSAMLEGCKNLTIAGTVTIKGALNDDNRRELKELAALLK